MFLKEVLKHGSHVSSTQQLDAMIEWVLETFMKNPTQHLTKNTRPKVKTLPGKLRTMIKVQGKVVRSIEETVAAEKLSDVDEPLEKIILPKDGTDKKKAVEIDSAYSLEKKLLGPDEDVRRAAAYV